MTILHLGCGRDTLDIPEYKDADIITLDQDAELKPKIVCTLGRDLIPLADDSVDVAIAIHVLEHIGKQGEMKEWFQFWEELYRVLKPDGFLYFESPLYSSVWAWSDPSHTRALSPWSFVFFQQESYRLKPTRISPFRINCDFVPMGFEKSSDESLEIQADERFSHFKGQLRANKPLKVWWKD